MHAISRAGLVSIHLHEKEESNQSVITEIDTYMLP